MGVRSARDGRQNLPVGEQPTRPPPLCWDRYETKQGTCAVGSFPAGVFGLKDMAGNVWEWTARDSIEHNRPIRGGSWYDADELRFRSANRVRQPTPSGNYYTGFRCARSL